MWCWLSDAIQQLDRCVHCTVLYATLHWTPNWIELNWIESARGEFYLMEMICLTLAVVPRRGMNEWINESNEWIESNRSRIESISFYEIFLFFSPSLIDNDKTKHKCCTVGCVWLLRLPWEIDTVMDIGYHDITLLDCTTRIHQCQSQLTCHSSFHTSEKKSSTSKIKKSTRAFPRWRERSHRLEKWGRRSIPNIRWFF